MGEHVTIKAVEKLRGVGLVFAALLVGLLLFSDAIMLAPLVAALFMTIYTATATHVIAHAVFNATGEFTDLFLWTLAGTAAFTPLAILIVVLINMTNVFTLMRFSLLLVPALWVALLAAIIMHTRKLDVTKSLFVAGVQLLIGGFLLMIASPL